jgi:phospholipid/cholesterol/gamma-HCH transport system permease protein
MNPVLYVVGTTGRASLRATHAALNVCVLMCETLNWMLIQPFRGKGLRVRSTLIHFVEFGAHSLPIVALICFLTGAIMAMQGSYQLARFGATQYIANLVGVAAMREFAPLMTAIILTGRSGSAIAAEIGSMKVAEEIDALEVMGVNPIKFLVVPKFLGMVFAVPCITILATFIMIFGGYLIGVTLVGIDSTTYIEQTIQSLQAKDFWTGIQKSIFFALTICWVGVYRGFQVEGGAEGVGKQTTSSVVTSIFLIVIVDLVFTVLFFYA